MFPMSLEGDGPKRRVICGILASHGKVFSTKTRAPYMIPLKTLALEVFQPSLAKEESKTSHNSDQFMQRVLDYDQSCSLGQSVPIEPMDPSLMQSMGFE